MSMDRLDTLVSKMIGSSTESLTDEELLSGTPKSEESENVFEFADEVSVPEITVPEITVPDKSRAWKEIPSDWFGPTFKRRDGLLGGLMDYMGGHPVSSVINFKLPIAFGKKLFSSPNISKKLVGGSAMGSTFGVQSMTNPVGAIEEALLPSLEHPDDAWKETIWNKKYEDMARNPEDYAE